MADASIHLDLHRSLAHQAAKGHNRWHPDIPAKHRVKSGSTVELDVLDGVDGQIRSGMKDADLAGIDMGRVHPLTGPVHVEGAEPGDLLAVKIEAVETIDYGFTAIMPGFGFLRDLFPDPFLVHWEISGGFAQSAQLPGVKIPGAPFMGVMGVAPSHELLARVNAREADLLARGGMVMPPDAAGAVPTDAGIAAKAFRTIAPHENGGNFDIKQLTKGTTLYLPVFVPGALFSVGDPHFAQGDGESCGTAVETAGRFVATFEVMKGEARRRKQHDPSYGCACCPAPAEGRPYYATTGMSVRREARRNRKTSRSPPATRW